MKIHTKHRRKIPLKWIGFLLFLIWIAVLSIWIQKRSAPSLSSMAKAQVNQDFQFFMSEFLESNDTYCEFLQIRYDQNGKIQSISADMKAVNQFKSALMQAYLKRQSGITETVLSIPLGNLTQQPLFYGRGPTFQAKILPCRQVSFDLLDTFSSAGINQTLHQIDLVITAEVEILLPNGISLQTVTGTVSLSKTLIVGDVPNLYPSSGLFSSVH